MSLVKRGNLSFVVLLDSTYLLPSFVFCYLDSELMVAVTALCECEVSVHISRAGCHTFCLSITVINTKKTGTGCGMDSALIGKGMLKILYIFLQLLYNDKFKSNHERLFSLYKTCYV